MVQGCHKSGGFTATSWTCNNYNTLGGGDRLYKLLFCLSLKAQFAKIGNHFAVVYHTNHDAFKAAVKFRGYNGDD